MKLHEKMPVRIGGLELESPIVIASGVWPMDTACWTEGALTGVGALCTKGLTLKARAGNPGTRVWETPCGLLNSIGLQNPGIEAFLRDEYLSLAKSAKPLIFNLAFESEEELSLLLEHIAGTGDHLPVELNVSCPNVSRGGLSWAQDTETLERLIAGARKIWKGPLWVKLSPNVPSIADSARAAERAGADALVVANTWLAMALDLEAMKPVFYNIHAGLSGPAIFPMALRLVWETSSAVGIPVIASGGVSVWEDAAAMIASGASAIQVGSALFSDINAPARILEGLSGFLERQKCHSIADLVGRAKCGKRLLREEA